MNERTTWSVRGLITNLILATFDSIYKKVKWKTLHDLHTHETSPLIGDFLLSLGFYLFYYQIRSDFRLRVFLIMQKGERENHSDEWLRRARTTKSRLPLNSDISCLLMSSKLGRRDPSSFPSQFAAFIIFTKGQEKFILMKLSFGRKKRSRLLMSEVLLVAHLTNDNEHKWLV